jgi:sugar phosphate isomerase/epimerase
MSGTLDHQIGAHTLIYAKESLDRALEGIAHSGLDTVGLYTEHAGAPVLPLRPTAAQSAEFRRRVEGHGLKLVTMFARRGATDQVDLLLADLDLCAELGMPLLQAAGPWPYASGQDRKQEMAWYGDVERFLSVLASGAAEAARRDITIVLKPHRGATATGADLVDVIQRVGSDAVRACWDAGNVRFYEGIDSEDDLENSGVAPFVRSVCIKDHLGPMGDPRFPIPGQGDVDHPRMLAILAAAGFHGPLLVERVDQPTAEQSDVALAQAVSYLRSVTGTAASAEETSDG